MRPVVWILLSLAACDSRAVSPSDGALDGRGGSDATAPRDGRLVPDGPVSRDGPSGDSAGCGGPERAVGLVSTMFEGTKEMVRTLPGHVTYHGPLTQPLASSPLFDREIQFSPYSGSPVVVQYHLPSGLTLPLSPSTSTLYVLTMQRTISSIGGTTEGLILKANVPGPWPFVLIVEPATYGQAFAPADPLLAPLKVKLIESTACAQPAVPGCAPRYVDRLRLEASTGAGLFAADLQQGETIKLTLFGQTMLVANLASSHQRPACQGKAEQIMRYVLLQP